MSHFSQKLLTGGKVLIYKLIKTLYQRNVNAYLSLNRSNRGNWEIVNVSDP